jgi:hypothetical protein
MSKNKNKNKNNKISVFQEQNPHYLTWLIMIGSALGLSQIGYSYGEAYVREQYVMGEPVSGMLGGQAGRAISFGLVLQIFRDLMRIPVVKHIDQTCGVTIREKIAALKSAEASSIYENLLSQEEALDLDRSDIGDDIDFKANKTGLAVLGLMGRRLGAYANTALLGASTSLLPLNMLFTSMDLYDPKTARLVTYLTCFIMLLQVMQVMAAYRADQLPAELVSKSR